MNKKTMVQTDRVLGLPHDEERSQVSAVERADCDLTGQKVSKQRHWLIANVTEC